jgi:hypothetical protein
VSHRNSPYGPFETAAEVLAAIESHGGSATDAEAGRTRLLMLRATLAAVHVEPGSVDMLVLARLAHWEPESAMVVAGLLERAFVAGQRRAAEGSS